MGILTRQQDDVFVITSDCPPGTSRTARAPTRLSEDYEVWTGSCWSAIRLQAITFASLTAADEYVRAHFAQITSRPADVD